MIEPFRHLVDKSVFEIQDLIPRTDYAFSRDGIVVLSGDLKIRYLNLLPKESVSLRNPTSGAEIARLRHLTWPANPFTGLAG
jgi:hypothetical protein